MNEIVTFFRNHKEDSGVTCQVTIELIDGNFSLLIYSKSQLSKQEVEFIYRNQKFSSFKLYNDYKKQLANFIAKNNGLIVEIKNSSSKFSMELASQAQGSWPPVEQTHENSSHNLNSINQPVTNELVLPRNSTSPIQQQSSKNQYLDIEIQICTTQSTSYFPPRCVFYLQPSYRLSERPFDGAGLSLRLHQGSHVILPVDKEAEEHFVSFRENYSAWFPRDFEPIMLKLLQQPELDLRVSCVEGQLKCVEGQLKENADKQKNQTPADKLNYIAKLIAVFLTLMLVSILVTLGFLDHKDLENTVNNINKLEQQIKDLSVLVQSAIPSQISASQNLPPIKNKQSSESIIDLTDCNELLELLSKYDNPIIKILWENYFKASQDKGCSFQNKEFLWGMIKLPAAIYVITKQIKDTAFLDKSIDAIKQTASFYDRTTELDDRIKDMLTFFIYKIQEIETDKNSKFAIKKFFIGGSFKLDYHINDEKSALPGITELKYQIEKISKNNRLPSSASGERGP